jgi:FtsH-binding integral membrane protein
MHRRNEKGEKGEKHEKNEKTEKSPARGMLGAVVAGLILIWLGTTYFLEQNGYLASDIWWAYFVSGVGIVLVLEGVVIYSRGHIGLGPVIGGAVLIFAGISAISTYNYKFQTQLWPLVIVAIGALVLVSGLAYRRRVPPP